MEPSGRNQRQPVANAPAPKAAKTSQICCHRLPLLACDVHAKEGVDGSSPSEGSAHKMPANSDFVVVCLSTWYAAGTSLVRATDRDLLRRRLTQLKEQRHSGFPAKDPQTGRAITPGQRFR